MQPRIKSVFGYEQGDHVGDTHKKKHAEAFVGLFDSILQMMGPDQEFIEDILHQVGMRHKKMGVKASFFPYMGDSLIDCLQKTLGDSFTEAHRTSWNELYDIISGEIVKAILSVEWSTKNMHAMEHSVVTQVY